jgi:rsbT antagonist protein RsbS
MSTTTIPIIHLRELLIVSVQTELSDSLVETLKDDVSHEIAARSPRGLIVEVSGVEIFDSYIAASIRQIAHVARLMGVATVVAGINAAMAITLVEMGMQMSGVRTALNLDAAVNMLERAKEEHAEEDAALLATMLGNDSSLESLS